MGKRHHSRRMALQVLYAREYQEESPETISRRLVDSTEISKSYWNPFCKELVERTIEDRESLDREIVNALEHWRIERLSKVDHIILRLALCEMRAFRDIPIRVTLNEYIELAKQFGTDDSSAFVNGILDRLSKQFADKDFDQKDGAPPPDSIRKTLESETESKSNSSDS